MLLLPRSVVLMVLMLVPSALASLVIDVADLSGDRGAMILTISRWPRIVAVMLTGAALAVAGVVMQELVRNRFVEPGTTGTGDAAARGLGLNPVAVMRLGSSSLRWRGHWRAAIGICRCSCRQALLPCSCW